MDACSARDKGQYELPGTQTLAKYCCGVSTEIPHSSNLTPINFGNWHICFKEQQVYAIWYTTNQTAISLDWRDQFSCEKLDFCLPWQIAGWQPSNLQSALLPIDAVSEEGQPDLLTAQTCLYKLSTRSRDEVPVPDRLVPTALYTFLTALGCGLKHTRLIVTQRIHAQLQSICILTRTRRMRVAEFWRQVGTVTSNEDAVTDTQLQSCPLCTLPATVFFQIQKKHGRASESLIHMSLWTQQEVLTASLQADGLTRVNSIMAQATDNHGAYLCFGCAASSLPDVYPPTVPPPVTTPPRMKPSGSKDPHTGLVDHVVGGCEEVSDQTVPIQHDLSPPFK